MLQNFLKNIRDKDVNSILCLKAKSHNVNTNKFRSRDKSRLLTGSAINKNLLGAAQLEALIPGALGLIKNKSETRHHKKYDYSQLCEPI